MAKGPLNFGDDEEAQSLIREAAGGLASAANNSTRTVIIQEKSSAVGVWKVLTMVLIGIVFLFATDSIEIKHASKGGKVEDIGAKVEKKVPHKAPNTGTQTTPNTGTTPKTTTYTQKQQKSQEDEVLEEVINDQEEVEEEMDELEEDLKGLEKEEKDIEQQIETLEETKDELETIEFEKIELEHTIDAIGEELQDTIEKEEELELVIAEEDTLTEEDKAEVEKEKEELDEKLDELEGELEDAQADEEELEKIDEAKEKIDKKIEEEEEELEAVEKEKEEVKEELNEVEEEKKELEAMVEVLDPNAADSSVSKSQSETPENPQGNENEEKTNKLDHGLDFTPGQDAGIRHTYSRRGQPMTDKEKNDIKKKWGSWTLVDEKERPTEDFYKEYLNRDIPRSKFPNDAWQIDKDYLAKFLPEGIALVQRAQDAILAEYGQPEKGEWEERAKMFHVEQFDELAGQKRLDKHESTNQGGWTTKKSWEGLKRRILHAVMTEDMFVFAMGGHSAAAGHGNHFQQSYTLQVQWIVEAVFARLGVRHQSRNFGNGGLGTLHNGFAAGSIYGPDVDMLMWDSGMTEREKTAQDMFHRQALMGGMKVPVLWTLAASWATFFNEHADADVGMPGSGYFGIKQGKTLDEIEQMPWAAQYVRCDNELKQICRKNEYIGQCWVERDDFTPWTTQKPEPGGRAGWHPGNRIHQVKGRVLAFTILQALKEALEMWNEADGYELADDTWHVTARYEEIRTKLAAIDPGLGNCKDLQKFGLASLCKYPMKGRTAFTPRAYPGYTSLFSLMSPEMKNNIGGFNWNVYNAPDVFNPSLHPPKGAIDVLNIVEAGVEFKPVLSPDYTDFYKQPIFANPPKVTPGKGIQLHTKASSHLCDGSVDSFCDRGGSNICLLYGHNDERGGLLFSSYSGWVVMNLPDLIHGQIVIKYHSWKSGSDIPRISDWTSINNERSLLSDTSPQLLSNLTLVPPGNISKVHDHRILKKGKKKEEGCTTMVFEFAIDGKVTSWKTGDKFSEMYQRPQRVVETLTLLDDPNFTGGIAKEVEVAIRMTGCEHKKAFELTHIYWA